MEKNDRDAVFKKANTKVLPIIYIDDAYVGDGDKLFELDRQGALDKLLKVNETRYQELKGAYKTPKTSNTSGVTSGVNKMTVSDPKPSSSNNAGKFCGNCGTQMANPNAKFCASCGSKI